MFSFLNNGFYEYENTPFKGLNILGSNSSILVESNKAKLESIDSFEQNFHPIKPTKNDYDDLTQVFLNSFYILRK